MSNGFDKIDEVQFDKHTDGGLEMYALCKRTTAIINEVCGLTSTRYPLHTTVVRSLQKHRREIQLSAFYWMKFLEGSYECLHDAYKTLERKNLPDGGEA